MNKGCFCQHIAAEPAAVLAAEAATVPIAGPAAVPAAEPAVAPVAVPAAVLAAVPVAIPAAEPSADPAAAPADKKAPTLTSPPRMKPRFAMKPVLKSMESGNFSRKIFTATRSRKDTWRQTGGSSFWSRGLAAVEIFTRE